MPSFAATTGGTGAPPTEGSLGRRRRRAARAFRRAAAARLRRVAAGLRARVRDLRHAQRRALQRGARSATRSTRRTTSPGWYEGEPDNVGWWDNMIGPGKPLDTNRFFVVGVNNLGSCFGSTGPQSINPATGKPWGGDFPLVTVEDWVDAQARLADRARHRAIRGGDGRQPGRHAGARVGDPLSGAHPPRAGDRRRAQPVGAEHRVQRGRAAGDHDRSRISTTAISPRTDAAAPRAARRADDRPHHVPVRRADGGEIRPPAARRHQLSRSRPSSRSSRTCATRARSSPSTSTRTRTCASPRRSTTSIRRPRTGGDLARALAPAECKFLVVSFTTDWRFPPARSREIVKALVDHRRDVCYAEIDAPHGHDAFLLDDPQYHALVRAYFERHRRATPTIRRFRFGAEVEAQDRRASSGHARRADFATIAGWIEPGAQRARPGLRRRQPARVSRARARGRGLRHRDRRRRRARERRRTASTCCRATSRRGLAGFDDASFDCVILSQTLQAMRHTEEIVAEMLRVGREVIVTFPNFGHWSHRWQILQRADAGVAPGCPTSGTTRRTSTFARSPTSTRSCASAIASSRTASCSRAGSAVTVLANLLGELAIYRFRRA